MNIHNIDGKVTGRETKLKNSKFSKEFRKLSMMFRSNEQCFDEIYNKYNWSKYLK